MNTILALLLLLAASGLFAAWLSSRPRGHQLTALANALPTQAFDPDDVVIGHTCWLEFTPTGGTLTTFKVKLVDYDGQHELLRNKDTGADGVSRTVRVRRSGSTEMFIFETREYKKFATLLGGKMTTIIDGDAIIYIRDYEDAALDVAIKVASFGCSIYRQNGANRFAAEGGDDAGTPVQMVIENTSGSDLVMSIDATA